MSTAVFYHSPDLPWSPSPENERRFRRIFATAVGVALLFSLLIPLLPVPEQLRELAPVMSQRYVRLLMERPPPPPPPRPAPQPEKPAAKKPPPVKEKPVTNRTHKPEPAGGKRNEAAARERAARSGLLAFSEELAALRRHGALASVDRRQKKTPSGKAGTAPKVERAVLTRRAQATSGGIDATRLSRDTGKNEQVTAHRTSRVESTLGQAAMSTEKGAGRGAKGGLPLRSNEEIQRVFDQNKGRLYALYNRALRRDAALQGKVVLRLTIDPSGRVTQCEILSSELNNPRLERRLVARIKMFDFGAREVAVTRITYPIDFFPG